MDRTSNIYEGTGYGKLNLSLYITGALNGYHTLDSVMATINIYDKVTYCYGTNQLEIEVQDKHNRIDVERYTKVLEGAIKKLEILYGPITGKIILNKGVPLGQGVGGSTASLVAIINALDKAFRKNIGLECAKLSKIGSDLPFMCNGGIKRVTGIGEKLDDIKLDVNNDIFALIIYGNNVVNTKDCYDEYDKLGKVNGNVLNNSLKEVLDNPYNALQEPAILLNSEIEQHIAILNQLGAANPMVTGSGSAVFTLDNDMLNLELMKEKISKISNCIVKIVKILR